MPASRPKATPTSKAASTPKAAPTATRRPAARTRPAAPAPILVHEPESPNYALRLTEDLDTAPEPVASEDTFAVRLNEALAAINAANGASPRPLGVDSIPRSAGEGGLGAEQLTVDSPPSPLDRASPSGRGSLVGWLAALDKLPPIRLPIGPAIPWKIGLPAMVVLVVLMGVMGRLGGQSDAAGVQLPAQQTYPVQQEAPLFAQPDATAVATPVADQQPRPIGVVEPSGLGGFDLVDVGIKLIAVLGLAYASLMLLKRFGYGGAGTSSARGGAAGHDVRVLSTIALAPNRSVHVIQVPGGKTLLVGATPTAVNLLTELPQQD